MRRSRIEIIRGILEATRRGATKTQIVYRSNLNFKLADECLARLLKWGYVVIVEGTQDGRPQFLTTEKGIAFLVELNRLGKALHEILEADTESDESDRSKSQMAASPPNSGRYI